MSAISEFDFYQRLIGTVQQIKSGDRRAREQFIGEYRPYILKTAINICKKPLEWGRDDELSISLIAFNAAIDTYDPGRGIPFLSYARLVITSRLKDYFRQESRHLNTCPLEIEGEEGVLVNPAVVQAAWVDHRERTIEDERQEELEYFEKLLSAYGISFEDLVESSPKHRDSRSSLYRVAAILTSEPELIEYLNSKKQLPLKELVEKTGINRKTLERGRKFIIASALIMSRPEEFIYLRSYINFDS